MSLADFQSSKTAQEIEEVFTGAVLFNTPQTLSETEKAFVRDKIGATELGEGIKILAHFDTYEQLEAAVPNPKVGAAYSVGTELPYNLYVFDSFHENWSNHGPIRSTDISARFAQNVVVGVDDWVEDTEVFVDFTYKAALPLGEVSGSDFPIVAFSPSDATGGNFCPIAFCFDGYVEIWARAIPGSAITVPAITFIVQSDGASGGSTKGITNASGGFATGGIGSAQIADGAMVTSKYANASVTRAKLAQDALYSPMSPTGSASAYTITLGDLGKTIAPSSGAASVDVVFTLPADVSANMPFGAELAILFRYGKSLKIKFESGARSAIIGDTTFVDSRTYQIPERFGMVALKKIDYSSSSGTQYWLVTGNVEVVSE